MTRVQEVHKGDGTKELQGHTQGQIGDLRAQARQPDSLLKVFLGLQRSMVSSYAEETHYLPCVKNTSSTIEIAWREMVL